MSHGVGRGPGSRVLGSRRCFIRKKNKKKENQIVLSTFLLTWMPRPPVSAILLVEWQHRARLKILCWPISFHLVQPSFNASTSAYHSAILWVHHTWRDNSASLWELVSSLSLFLNPCGRRKPAHHAFLGANIYTGNTFFTTNSLFLPWIPSPSLFIKFFPSFFLFVFLCIFRFA